MDLVHAGVGAKQLEMFEDCVSNSSGGEHGFELGDLICGERNERRLDVNRNLGQPS
ncbi:MULTISPECIES: hypothetical protein [Methylobacterium]|uniref:Uncharacterized protein n=1 Tax=Methylobacterium radiotolerans TaxID=31998 RepID=A0ABV2N8C3_9HYPH|nr:MULTISPECIES: hypothetical protein [unclassified Methylobacterium]MBP2498238.1 hypothetical protein [Methylobacterium sp. PvP105]MBP2506373.1 hypothetical protein [Methylobacterium sp. PvP109]